MPGSVRRLWARRALVLAVAVVALVVPYVGSAGAGVLGTDGFESGDSIPTWSCFATSCTGGSATVTDFVHSGSRSLLVEGPTGDQGDEVAAGATMTAGSSYTFEAWLLAPAGTTSNGDRTLCVYSAGNAATFTCGPGMVASAGHGWVLLSVTVTPTATASDWRFRLQGPTNAGSGTVSGGIRYDDLSVYTGAATTTTTAPATTTTTAPATTTTTTGATTTTTAPGTTTTSSSSTTLDPRITQIADDVSGMRSDVLEGLGLLVFLGAALLVSSMARGRR